MYNIVLDQSFNGKIFKIIFDGQEFFIGIANIKEGSYIYYPKSGKDHILVMFNNSIYRFPMEEFIWPFREIYLMEKLKCSKKEAYLIYTFVKDELSRDAAIALLMGQETNNLLTKGK